MADPFHFSVPGTEAVFDGKFLTLKNAGTVRIWQLCNGWKTVYTGFQMPEAFSFDAAGEADWDITACSGCAELLSAECRETDQKIRITSIFHYPESHIYLKHEIDCYPGISGMRTQISMKHEKEIPAQERSPERDQVPQFVSGYSESIPFSAEHYKYVAFGFNNDSQHRYSLDMPILTESRREAHPVQGRESIGNCNGIIFADEQERGFILVKESHKCANSPGIATGEFILFRDKIVSTGLGFSDGSPHWLSGDDYRPAWANWMIPFRNGAFGAVQALKEFDRARYPFRKDRDMFIAMNTWGSRGDGSLSRLAAVEENVLAELESCADLGIDLLQIDDGWQFDPGTADFQNCAWNPSEKGFPHGWSAVRERAKKLGMKLGLWAPPDFITAEQLLKNIQDGGFRRIKLDFLNLTKRKLLDETLSFAKSIVDGADEPVGINWDITEACPRMGFYFGREYGNIFLQNCENSPQGATFKRFIAYDPEVTLNQTWLLSKYFNLNQVQITIQRIAESPHGKGYSQDYACGIALMGNPLFFLETRRFTEDERKLVKDVISVYKQHREQILSGYVYPVGNQPDGTTWTGFQCICSDHEGYLTVFREKAAAEDEFIFELNHVPAGKQIKLTGLYRGKDTLLVSDENGRYCFCGLPCGSWAFYRYEVV